MVNEYEECIIRSDLKELFTVQGFVETLCAELNIVNSLGIISAAVFAAVENAIVHGNRFDSSKKVRITYFKSDTSVIFRIEDEGNGFDFRNYRFFSAPLMEKGQGRGMLLMRKLCKQLKFTAGGRIVEMHFPFVPLKATENLNRIKAMEQYFLLMQDQNRSSQSTHL